MTFLMQTTMSSREAIKEVGKVVFLCKTGGKTSSSHTPWESVTKVQMGKTSVTAQLKSLHFLHKIFEC